jgi:hypothetical protein
MLGCPQIGGSNRPVPQVTDRATWQARIDELRVKERPTEVATGDSADGRALLQRFAGWKLWLQRRHRPPQATDTRPAHPLTRRVRLTFGATVPELLRLVVGFRR